MVEWTAEKMATASGHKATSTKYGASQSYHSGGRAAQVQLEGQAPSDI